MTEEHIRPTFTWRKTAAPGRVTLYTLMSWENVLPKEDLPYEYIELVPHFWDAGDHVYINENNPRVRHTGFARVYVPPKLYRGYAMGEGEFNRLSDHLSLACRSLKRAKLRVSESEEFVLEIDPAPEPEPVIPDDPDPAIAFDTAAYTKEPAIEKKLSVFGRIKRAIRGKDA